MRDYGKVHTSFWISDDMRRVSDDARLLALYLLTGQHTNMIGCFRLPDGYVSEDLGWGFERVSKGFDELCANGFIARDSDAKWVLIRNFMVWNSIDNPNQGISALRLFTQVPDKSCVKPVLARVIASALTHIEASKLKGCERVLKPFLNQEQEQEQEQEDPSAPTGGKPEKKPKAQKYSDEFEAVWAEYPKRAGGADKAGAFKSWNARLQEGFTVEEIREGVLRYAKYVSASGKAGTEFVKQAKTFFGPSRHFNEEWIAHPAKPVQELGGVSKPDKAIPGGFVG